MSDERLRLFIASTISGPAVEPVMKLTQTIREQLEPERDRLPLRWAPPQHWHLTWHFLGQSPPEAIPAIRHGMDMALSSQLPVIMPWHELNWWPSKSRPQILVGLLESTPTVQALHQAVLQAIGNIPIESPATEPQSAKRKLFKPHITLARINTRQATRPYRLPLLPAIPENCPAWQIDTITLFRSELASSGAIHTPIHSVNLITNRV